MQRASECIRAPAHAALLCCGVQANILAARAVTNIMKSSLGPMGMDKMLVSTNAAAKQQQTHAPRDERIASKQILVTGGANDGRRERTTTKSALAGGEGKAADAAPARPFESLDAKGAWSNGCAPLFSLVSLVGACRRRRCTALVFAPSLSRDA